MPSTVLDLFDVLKGFRAGMVGTSAITDLLGTSPMRIHQVVPKPVLFPWVRLDMTPIAPLTGVRPASVGGINWLRQVKIALVTFTQDRTMQNAAAILAVLQNFMDNSPGTVTFTGGKVFQAVPRFEHVDYDPEAGGAFASCEYDVGLTPT